MFQVDGGAYNGKDAWAWEICERELPFANWARGYFWGDWSGWEPARFEALPANPLCDRLRTYARSGLGAANQWGGRGVDLQHLRPGLPERRGGLRRRRPRGDRRAPRRHRRGADEGGTVQDARRPGRLRPLTPPGPGFHGGHGRRRAAGRTAASLARAQPDVTPVPVVPSASRPPRSPPRPRARLPDPPAAVQLPAGRDGVDGAAVGVRSAALRGAVRRAAGPGLAAAGGGVLPLAVPRLPAVPRAAGGREELPPHQVAAALPAEERPRLPRRGTGGARGGARRPLQPLARRPDRPQALGPRGQRPGGVRPEPDRPRLRLRPPVPLPRRGRRTARRGLGGRGPGGRRTASTSTTPRSGARWGREPSAR